jgi:hypothetical protein
MFIETYKHMNRRAGQTRRVAGIRVVHRTKVAAAPAHPRGDGIANHIRRRGQLGMEEVKGYYLLSSQTAPDTMSAFTLREFGHKSIRFSSLISSEIVE